MKEFNCILRVIFSLFTSFNIATWYGSEVKDRSGNNFNVYPILQNGLEDNEIVGIITPDKEIVENSNYLDPAYIVFNNYELILQWNRSLRFALAVCNLKDKFSNEL